MYLIAHVTILPSIHTSFLRMFCLVHLSSFRPTTLSTLYLRHNFIHPLQSLSSPSLPPSRTLTHSHPHFFSLLHPLSLTLNVSLICILLPFMKSRFIRIPHIITPCKSKLTLLSPSFSLFLVLPVNPTLLATPSLLIFFLIPAIHYSHFFTLFSLHYSSHPI